MSCEVPDAQAGFGKGRGTRDQIFIIHCIIEKARVPEIHLFLLYWLCQSLWQCESESEVSQSCFTLCDHMLCSLPGFSVHGIFQARIPEWVSISFSRGIFPIQGSNLHLPHCRQMLNSLSHQESLFFEVFWLFRIQQTIENSSRDGNTRPLYLPPEISVCRSRRSG